MNDSSTTTVLSPTPAASKPMLDLSQNRWIGRTLLTALGLTFLADMMLYGVRPGLGWSLFFAAFWGGIILNRDLKDYHLRKTDVAVLVGMVLTLCQFAWRASFSSGLCLFLFTFYLGGHLLYRSRHPWWSRFAEQLFSLTAIPLRWAQSSFWLSMGGWKKEADGDGEKSNKTKRLVEILLAPILLTVLFLVLLGQGNAILGKGLNEAFEGILESLDGFEFPSLLRLFFWGFAASVVLGLLWRSKRSRTLSWLASRGQKETSAVKDAFVGIWRMRFILIAVNLVFFLANGIDVGYLWSGIDVPKGMTTSEFVHSGTNSLIASVIIAAIVISVLFQQSLEITQAKGQRFLAMLWLGQNLLLIGNVLLRVKIYVDDYQLSTLRLHLCIFLALAVVGFLLLGIRVIWNRKFAWLAGANLLAVFLLFFLLQFWDTRAFVARSNVQQMVETEGKRLDVPYLSQLGVSGWASLHALSETENQWSSKARRMLEEIREEELDIEHGEEFSEIQFFRKSARKRFLRMGRN